MAAYDTLVSYLKAQVGKPYRVDGGRFGPDHFDCSGLAVAAYARLGINLAGDTYTQVKQGQTISDYRGLQPGDLIFTDGSKPPFGHVKIYIGNGQVIQAASTQLGVIQSTLDMGSVTAVRRVMDSAGSVIRGDLAPVGHSANVKEVSFSEASSGGSSSGSSGSSGGQVPGSNLNPEGGQQGGTVVKPPSDGRLVRSPWDGKLYLFYDVGGVTISYDVPDNGTVDVAGMQETTMSREQFTQTNAVLGGSALELQDVGRSYGTYSAFFDSILQQVMGTNNPARNDAGVRRIIAEFAARPDMSPTELQNRLQGTEWYQHHTEAQLQWDEKPQAEKDKLKQDMASQMAQSWLQYLGIQLDPNDPRIINYVEDLASGKKSFGNWIESIVKPAAQQDVNSPFSRQLRDEQKARKQQGVDVENQMQQVRQMAKQWGLQWSEDTVRQWGAKLEANDASMDDVIQTMKLQAHQLYPTKDIDQTTADYAQPYMETYRRVLEKDGDIFNPKMQSAMAAGTANWEFEQQLKNTDEWVGTKNFRSDISGAIAQAGRQMGYV